MLVELFHAIYNLYQGTMGCTPNVRVPMVFIVFGLGILGDNLPINTHYIGISHRGTLVGVHPTIP